MRIHHIALRTSDLPTLERFYTTIFKLDATRRDGERSVWLDAGGVILMLERIDAGEPAIDPASKELLCFAIEPVDYAELLARLECAAIVIEGRTPSTLYFRDPDGRRVGASSYPAVLT